MTSDRPDERAPRPRATPTAADESGPGADAAVAAQGTDEGSPPPPPPASRPPRRLEPRPAMPEYKGAELDPARGPGLGCFWFQVIVLAVFVVLIPIGYNLNWPFEVLAILLFVVIGLLLFVGQTLIFLLRLVAADRRTTGRRRPLASATRTVGELEDEQRESAHDAAELGGDPVGGGAEPPESRAVPVDTGPDPIGRVTDPAGRGADAAEPGPGPGGVRE